MIFRLVFTLFLPSRCLQNGCTPLICAIKNKNSDAALVLIEKGADLRAKDAVR